MLADIYTHIQYIYLDVDMQTFCLLSERSTVLTTRTCVNMDWLLKEKHGLLPVCGRILGAGAKKHLVVRHIKIYVKKTDKPLELMKK